MKSRILMILLALTLFTGCTTMYNQDDEELFHISIRVQDPKYLELSIEICEGEFYEFPVAGGPSHHFSIPANKFDRDIFIKSLKKTVESLDMSIEINREQHDSIFITII